MKWQEYIYSNPEILRGKPVVKGTRLSVEFILSLYEKGWNEDTIKQNFPSLSHEALKGVFMYIRECMELETIFDTQKS